MISLNINIISDNIVPNKPRYDQQVSDSLQEIADIIPDHTTEIFIRRLWGYFKLEIWKQQGFKCAFCEKTIVADDSHLEHFRPKSEARDEQNVLITREAYWWLVYDHRNYLVTCSTCNNQKGNKFPIEDNNTRIIARDFGEIVELDDEGVLGNEKPCIINPRYRDPEPHFAYSYTPDTIMPMVFMTYLDDFGRITIHVPDLNRKRKNENAFKDQLVRKRGIVLKKFKNELQKYKERRDQLLTFKQANTRSPDVSLRGYIRSLEPEINKMIEQILTQFLSYTAEFSGMCLFWLKNDTDLGNDFLERAA